MFISSTKMGPTLPLLIFCLFLFLLPASPFSSSTNVFKTSFAEREADKYIRAFNLFPKHKLNIVPPANSSSSSSTSPRLVETKFAFPSMCDSGATVENLGHHAGYFQLPHSNDARMFYFFFESRTKSKGDPVVIWLNGGPGCSSSIGLFYENGPFHLTKNLSLAWNDFGWDKVSNIIYVDQPVGTGFSYISNKSDIRSDEKGVSNDLYDFLQEFFKAHPEYSKNEFYITGESYAGHYIPAFASRIYRGNKNREGIHINLKGLAIGNGLTDPAIQYRAYTNFAFDNKLINKSTYNSISQMIPLCEQEIQLCAMGGNSSCRDAYFACDSILSSILRAAGHINYYDIRKRCVGALCYNLTDVDTFLNQKSVQDALGVHTDFVSCSTVVYRSMLTDWMKNLEVEIPELLENGIKVLIYAGEYDLICNWIGNLRWVHAMKWSGQVNLLKTSMVPFKVDGVTAGHMQSYGPLIFLKVRNAGHMVPMDQPKSSLVMLTRWMQDRLTTTKKQD